MTESVHRVNENAVGLSFLKTHSHASLHLLHASLSGFLQKLHLAAVAPTGWKAVEAAISQAIILHDQRDALLHADSMLGINSQSLHKIKMHFVILMQYLAHQ